MDPERGNIRFLGNTGQHPLKNHNATKPAFNVGSSSADDGPLIGVFGPDRVAQSITCLATDACLTADPGVASSIPVRSHTFVEIDHEQFLRSFSSLPLIYSRRVGVSYKRKYMHELLVNRLFKPDQEKVWLGELTVPQ